MENEHANDTREDDRDGDDRLVEGTNVFRTEELDKEKGDETSLEPKAHGHVDIDVGSLKISHFLASLLFSFKLVEKLQLFFLVTHGVHELLIVSISELNF